MADKPNLHTLPQELFDFVTEELDPADLLNLRLVCSEANSKVFDTFKRVHFTDYSILLCDKQSLKTTRAVVEHPVFGPTLRKITIFIDEVDYHYDNVPHILDWDDDEKYEHINQWIAQSHGGDKRARDQCMQAIAELDEVRAEHQLMRKHAEDISTLTDIFSTLCLYGHTHDIEIADDVANAACRPRVRQQFQLTALSGDGEPVFGLIPPSQLDKKSFATILEAVSTSKLTVKCLDVTAQSWSLNAHECGDCEPHLLSVVSANLESLSIPIHLNGPGPADTFVQMLATATSVNLKSLELYLYYGEYVSRFYSGHVLPRELLQESMPGLRELSLHAADIVASDLDAFIQAHPTLERLRLYDACVGMPTGPCYLHEFESQGAENIMDQVLKGISGV